MKKIIIRRLIAGAAALGILMVQAGAVSFRDIGNHWGKESIEYVVRKGLMNGTGDSLFQPDAPMTRAMLVTVLYRLDGEQKTAEASSFSDVAAGSWYADAVGWAAANGLVSGTGAGRFSPMVNITREQLAVILYHYSNLRVIVVPNVGTSDITFPDAGQIASYAKEPMRWAAACGLISGLGDGSAAPKKQASRAEVDAVLMRYLTRAGIELADKVEVTDNSASQTTEFYSGALKTLCETMKTVNYAQPDYTATKAAVDAYLRASGRPLSTSWQTLGSELQQMEDNSIPWEEDTVFDGVYSRLTYLTGAKIMAADRQHAGT